MKFNTLLKEKVYESIASVVPITSIVLFLSMTAAVGVGIFLVAAQLRMLFKIPLSFTLLFFYL